MENDKVEQCTNETNKTFGKTGLKIKLAADMDKGFVDRLSRFCDKPKDE